MITFYFEVSLPHAGDIFVAILNFFLYSGKWHIVRTIVTKLKYYETVVEKIS
ncbi:hypothetical protein SAMN02745131_00348 [Flavisolibacter ginsengisoli DSM 18119]|jgi:hypothetical protein|uniref:Uncharacterized protein n=1 Tax=Flavisolibacter ginsengisoli DSM 18119 TaxID=1121884 RepID=A0A1M4T5C3_9BACT|nr:hypothetical protein SAMN02745131_00348 [Flavisolibacter ginsengisoli DSM 18119]